MIDAAVYRTFGSRPRVSTVSFLDSESNNCSEFQPLVIWHAEALWHLKSLYFLQVPQWTLIKQEPIWALSRECVLFIVSCAVLQDRKSCSFGSKQSDSVEWQKRNTGGSLSAIFKPNIYVVDPPGNFLRSWNGLAYAGERPTWEENLLLNFRKVFLGECTSPMLRYFQGTFLYPDRGWLWNVW